MHIDKEIDTSGLNCPLPILKAKKALNEMSSGQVLKVTATDPGAWRDFEAFARQTGNDLLLQEKMVMVFFRSSVNRTGISLIANIFNQISDKEKRKRLPRAFYCLKEERPVLEGGKTDFYALRKKIQDIEPLWEKPAKTA